MKPLCYIISRPDNGLLGILNSKLRFFLFRQILPKLRGDFFELSYLYFKDFPIVKDESEEIESLVDEILTWKKLNPINDILDLENQIDQLVYELYGLNEEEIKIIEGV